MQKKLKIKNLLFIFCLTTFFWSCKQSENPLLLTTIEADVTSNEEMKLTDYFENFKMVKLSSDSVMDAILRLRYENDRIYITDGNSMFIFSNTGNLVHHFSKIGNGPGEYSGIGDFIVHGDSIIILNRTARKLITYNHSGEFVSARPVNYWPSALSPMINNTFFIYCGNDYEPQAQHKLRRIQNDKENSQYLPIDENQSYYLNIKSEHSFNTYKNSIYFFEGFCDTVFESVNGGDVVPSFFVDYQGKNIPASFFEHPYADVREFFQAYFQTSYAYGVVNFAKYDRFLMFGSFYQQKQKLTVFEHANHISHTYATLQDDIYFKGLTRPVSEFSYHAADHHIVLPVDAANVVEWRKTNYPEEQFKEMVDATKEDDNPILLIFDFKK